MTDKQYELHRPLPARARRYAALSDSAPTKPNRQELFTMNINAASDTGGRMDEQQLLIDLVFKPMVPGLKLRPAESQLLLAYIGEILKEIEEEEKHILQEANNEANPCN